MPERLLRGNGDLIKQVNRSLVLDLVRRKGPISKADVKQITGLNFTTVTNAVRDLIAEGFVQEVGYGTSSGGRRPLLLTLNTNSHFVLGCELQSTKLEVGLFDLAGKLLDSVAWPKLPGTSPAEVVHLVATGVQALLARAKVAPDQVEGMGVAAPGPLNSATGVLYTPPNLTGWRKVPLKRILEDTLGISVVVEKDGNAAALGEVCFGAGRDVRDLVFIIVDAGIGAGIVAHGHLYRGSYAGAGEIGHTTIDVDGPLCSCGNYGCLEAIASGFALERKAGEAIRRGSPSVLASLQPHDAITLDTLLAAAAQGDKLACDLLDECGRILGIGIANVVNMYNPELIVLGGRLAQGSQIVFDKAKEMALTRSFSVFSEGTRIITTELGDRCLVVGAAALVFTQIFRGAATLPDLQMQGSLERL